MTRRAWLMLGWGIVLLTVVDGVMLSLDAQHEPSQANSKSDHNEKRAYGPVVSVVLGALAIAEEFITAHEKLLIVASTIAIAIFTGTLYRATSGLQALAEKQTADIGTSLGIASDAANAAKESADAATRAADALPNIERAYVFLDSVKISWVKDLGNGTKEVYMAFILKNHGKTPAILNAVFGEVRLCKSFAEAVNARAAIFPSGKVIGAGATDLFYSVPTVVNAVEYAASSTNGIPMLIFFGKVAYFDVLKNVQWTDYCWRYDGAMDQFRLALDPEHNGWS